MKQPEAPSVHRKNAKRNPRYSSSGVGPVLRGFPYSSPILPDDGTSQRSSSGQEFAELFENLLRRFLVRDMAGVELDQLRVGKLSRQTAPQVDRDGLVESPPQKQ